MAVGFDAVGPGATGTSAAFASTLTWNHTVGASGTYLLVAATCDDNPDTGFSMTAKYNTVLMTPLGSVVHAGASTVGFLQVWGMASPPTGSALAVLITVSGGTATTVTGGSLSFTGATALSAPQSTTGNSGTQTFSFTPTVSGNMLAGFCGCGSALTTAGSLTSRFIVTTTGGAGCGELGAQTLASTGSAMVPSWTSASDSWAVIAVEVQAPAGTDTGPNYAGAASDLGGGSGSWVNPGNADSAPDSSYAVWTSP